MLKFSFSTLLALFLMIYLTYLLPLNDAILLLADFMLVVYVTRV